MAKELTAKVEDQLFPGVRLQEPTSEPEQPAQCSDRYHEPDGQAKDGRLGLREGGRQYRLDEAGDRVRSDNAVDRDLQRQRRQELEGDRQQTEQEDTGQVGPTRFGLAQEATVKREVAVSAATDDVCGGGALQNRAEQEKGSDHPQQHGRGPGSVEGRAGRKYRENDREQEG